MDTEFHYWVTGIVAWRAGFRPQEAATIAYASQFVDDNDVQMMVADPAGGAEYEGYISQTLDITKPMRELMRIYPIFHFLPGELSAASWRRDGKMHKLNVTPDSPLANRFMEAALQSDYSLRMHRIGIASHAYADTWAHQGFVGWTTDFNWPGLDLTSLDARDVSGALTVLTNMSFSVPGHAFYTHSPDMVNHTWKDDRLVQPLVDNNQRFLQAAGRMYEWYRRYNQPLGQPAETTQDALMNELGAIFRMPKVGDRIQAYKAAAPFLEPYTEDHWPDAAFDTQVRGLPDSRSGLQNALTLWRDRHTWKKGQDHTQSDWWKFQESLKQHQALGMDSIGPLLAEMGVNLHDH